MPGDLHVQWLRTDLTVPAGTAEASAISQDFDLGVAELLTVVVRVPPGHMGTTGFGLDYAGTRVLPFGGAGDWIIANDERIELDLNLLTGGAVQLRGYNTDTHDHTFYVSLHVDLWAAERATGPAVRVPL